MRQRSASPLQHFTAIGIVTSAVRGPSAVDMVERVPMREDVRARLVEAYARSGDAGAARRAADAYLDEFPHGRHVQAIQGWLRLP